MVAAMCIFGTIGIFVRHIPLPSSVVALVRGCVGTGFLLLLLGVRGQRLCWAEIRPNLARLCLSGAMIGFNWILLFEAYRYTTVAVATLCYYLAPIFVILAAPFFLGERLNGKKVVCVLTALLGMVIVSGVGTDGLPGRGEGKGILLGVAAAGLYAAVVLLNQTIGPMGAYDKTIVQLGTAAVVLLPYTLITQWGTPMPVTWGTVALLVVVGVLNTGIAYALYFGSMGELKAQTVAIFSYIDPVVAILLSALLLREPLGLSGGVGAVLILGAALASQLGEKPEQG